MAVLVSFKKETRHQGEYKERRKGRKAVETRERLQLGKQLWFSVKQCYPMDMVPLLMFQ